MTTHVRDLSWLSYSRKKTRIYWRVRNYRF